MVSTSSGTGSLCVFVVHSLFRAVSCYHLTVLLVEDDPGEAD